MKVKKNRYIRVEGKDITGKGKDKQVHKGYEGKDKQVHKGYEAKTGT